MIAATTFLTTTKAIDVRDIQTQIQHSIAICAGLTLLVVSFLALPFLESARLGAASGIGLGCRNLEPPISLPSAFNHSNPLKIYDS